MREASWSWRELERREKEWAPKREKRGERRELKLLKDSSWRWFNRRTRSGREKEWLERMEGKRDTTRFVIIVLQMRERRRLEGGWLIVRRKRTNGANWREGREVTRNRKWFSNSGRELNFTSEEKRGSERSPARV
jgi:hypothetical protein